MALTAHTKHALRLSLGQSAGTEMINAVEGFAATLAALAVEALAAEAIAEPVTQPSAPAAPVTTVPAAEEDASHLDAPAS